MVSAPAPLRNPSAASILGGVVYAVVVLSWILSVGVRFASEDPVALAIGLAYVFGGLVLTAAVPLYLLGRLSLVSPAIATLWLLGDTAYQSWYGTHPHPLSSYLTVWPLLLGLAVVPAVAEAATRIGLDRFTGRFGLRQLL